MDAAAMNALLAKQKAAHLRDGEPSAQVRAERIDRAIALLIDNRRAIEDAVKDVIATRLKSLAAGKMGFSTSQVGDLIAERI